MGMAIEQIAIERGHEIVLKVSIDNLEDNTADNIGKADVAIEFSGPESAYENILRCFEIGVPVVSGSTGWLEKLEEVKQHCMAAGSGFIYASNYSVGVNIFFAVNEKLAALMAQHPGYSASITEIHHTQKLDSPSGTAITLAEQILKRQQTKKKWVNHISSDADVLPIISERVDAVPGTHKISYKSDIDDIDIIHTAHNRKGFAMGAVLAAEFLQNKKGIYSMKDVLNI